MTGAQPGSSREDLIVALVTRLTSTETDVAEPPYSGTVQAKTGEASFSAGRSRDGTAGMNSVLHAWEGRDGHPLRQNHEGAISRLRLDTEEPFMLKRQPLDHSLPPSQEPC